MTRSRLVLILISESANRSTQVHEAARLAFACRVRVLPVRIEAVQLLSPLDLYLGGTQWFEASLPPLTQHFDSLADILARIVSKARRAELWTSLGNRRIRLSLRARVTLLILAMVLSLAASLVDESSILFTGPFVAVVAGTVFLRSRRQGYPRAAAFGGVTLGACLLSWILAEQMDWRFLSSPRPIAWITLLYDLLIAFSLPIGILALHDGLPAGAGRDEQEPRPARAFSGPGEVLRSALPRAFGILLFLGFILWAQFTTWRQTRLSRAYAQFHYAEELERSGYHEEALRHYADSIRFYSRRVPDPSDLRGRAHAGRARIFLAREGFGSALAEYTEAIEDLPRYPEMHAGRARALLTVIAARGDQARGGARLRRWAAERAVADFSTALDIDPEDPELYRGRAMAALAWGRPDLARADLKRAAALRRDASLTEASIGALE